METDPPEIEPTTLSRDDLEKWVSHDEFDEIVSGSFVRVLLEGDADRRKYRVAKISGVSSTQGSVTYTFGNFTNTSKLLQLDFGSFTATYQMNTISNSTITGEEFEMWWKFATAQRTIDRTLFAREMEEKQHQISAFRVSNGQGGGAMQRAAAATIARIPQDAEEPAEQQSKKRLLEKGKTTMRWEQERERMDRDIRKKDAELVRKDQEIAQLRRQLGDAVFHVDPDSLSTQELHLVEEKVEEYRTRVRRALADKSKCSVCMAEEAAVIFYPCKHQTTCRGCSGKMVQCPQCRATIQDRFVPFMH